MACRHFNLLLCHCWDRQLKPPHSFLCPTASLSNAWAHSGVKSVALGTPLLTAFLISLYSSIQPCLSSITAECISTHNQCPFPRLSVLWGRMTSLVFMSHSNVRWSEELQQETTEPDAWNQIMGKWLCRHVACKICVLTSHLIKCRFTYCIFTTIIKVIHCIYTALLQQLKYSLNKMIASSYFSRITVMVLVIFQIWG